MADFNLVVEAGNLTRDPELRFTNNGIPVCNFGIAVNRVRSQNDEVDFFDVTAWRELGETIANYKKKGDPILIKGRLQFRSWEAQDGSKRNKVDIVADEVQFLPRGQGGEFENGGSAGGQKVGAAAGGSGSSGNDAAPADFEDGQWDDIPFHHAQARQRVVTDIL
ncbi:single-stranded DNA-binding protein [Rubrobacter aplysinae]|uniref:single-stranded DNA-binding protein n=1 Tax=Rubrobacter aplysinae TaxID=909625 RepID=UPI00064C11F4|nr:single-stranded DNA-binding protein [Rubrobacter aplysinae]